MTVSTQVSRNEYTGNGATTQYDFTFRILDKSHLLVQTLDTSESIVTLTLGTDYTVTGVNRYNGGKVVLTSALPAGYKISIERSTPVTQEASIRNQGGFFPEIHEDAFDKLTMLIQQCFSFLRLALRKPSFIANYYDALNNRIRNLRDPSQAQDAATKNYVDNSIDGSNAHADDLFKKTLRFPDYVETMSGVPGRRDSLQGFNNIGKPVPVFSFTETADLSLKLSDTDGLQYIGQCPDINTLRSTEFSSVNQQIFVAEHTTGMGQGGGIFYCHSLTNDSSLIDDNGFQIINNYGQVIRRKDRSRMSAEMFGAIGGQDVMPVLENIRKASITFNRAVCYFPPPANGINYLHTGGFVVDVTQGYGLCIVCESTDEIDVPFDHVGNNIAFTFKRNNAAANTAFYKQSGITGALIRGRNSDNTAAGNDGFAVRVSDIIKAKVNVFVNGYTNTSGAAISLYNDTGYTEKSRIKATIRGCCNGVLIHRNSAAGATSTNSFFGTHLDIEYQAGVPGKANKGIVVGNIDGTTTSNTFDINFYASNISLKYWAEAGSITNGIYVGSKAIVPESTTVDLISDGYGFSTSDTDTTTIAATNLIRVENGGIFRAKCMDQSMQTGLSHRLNQLQRLRNSIFSFQDDTYKVPYTDARPYINPVGMSCICSGTIDVATQQAGSSWLISGLPMGMRIKVTINQYLEGESVTSVQEVWEVLVRGDAQSVICTPLVTNDVLTTTSGLAVINSSFATASFLKSVAAAFGKFWQGDSTRTRLTVRNNNDDNSLTTGASDGRKFRIFLPINASANSILHYSVKLEVV
ncbi:phage tail fiber domain-containing protein [Klebsiella pneumoniae]